ncbi:hypothetical protein F4604DRAFT_903939 [Suillus subluteus]|nr:hypothetical protein F4604DRAFT_903939 [Suillus subluteus]
MFGLLPSTFIPCLASRYRHRRHDLSCNMTTIPKRQFDRTKRVHYKEFILPDLVSDIHYPLRLNPHYYPISRAYEQWLLTGAHLTEPEIITFIGLHAGELAAACFPNVDAFHLRVCSDFMNRVFNMDDWMDEFDVDGTWGMRQCCISAFRDPINSDGKARCNYVQSYFRRFRQTSGPGCTGRFIRTIDLFFIAVDDRAKAAGVYDGTWQGFLESFDPF